MSTINERCYGHEPAATEIKRLLAAEIANRTLYRETKRMADIEAENARLREENLRWAKVCRATQNQVLEMLCRTTALRKEIADLRCQLSVLTGAA